MGYTIKQKIEICLKSESNPEMTQADLAKWAQDKYESSKPPSQTTISRILSSKNDIIGAKETDYKLIRRRKQSNPLLRKILTEWITQAIWENIPITTPIIQSTANAIWNRLPKDEKDGNGIFNQKWCHHFMKKLNINLIGDPQPSISNSSNANTPAYKLNKVWRLDEKIELKTHLINLIREENYSPQDIFVIDEFQLFYSLPLDQIFDVSSIDKGLKQSNSSTEKSLTIMLGCNIDGSEKLIPLIVGKYDKFDVSKSNHMAFKNHSTSHLSQHTLMNKITEVHQIYYKSNINKWITSSMFQNYLLTLDHKIEQLSPHRKILILLDDSSSHRIINLKFNNIKLCYLKNNINHKNPTNSVFNGVGGIGGGLGGIGGGSSGGSGGGRFDYLPMNFGIIDEFRILYRLQQYLEMINLQRINSKKDPNNNNSNNNNNNNNGNESDPNNRNPNMDLSNYNKINASSAMEVLSEKDYHIPLIKVIEWIKRSWDSISSEKIYLAWKRTFLLPLSQSSIAWPASNLEISNQGQQIVAEMLAKSNTYDPSKSYNKLAEIMGYLNVVIPWEIDELLGLVNEMGKVTLSYVSIEEIIGSCLSENYDSSEDEDNNPPTVPNDVSALVNDDQWYQPSANDNVNPFGNNKLYEDSPGSLLDTMSNSKSQQSQQPAPPVPLPQQQQQQSQPTPLDLAYADFASSPSGGVATNSNANRALNTLIGVTEREVSTLADTNVAINLMESNSNKNVATSSTAVDIATPGRKFGMSPSLPSPTTTNLLNSLTQGSNKHKIDDGGGGINWLTDKRRAPALGSYNPGYSIVSGTPSPMLGNNMPLNTSQTPLVVPDLSQSYMSSQVKSTYPSMPQFRSPIRGYSDLTAVSASSSTLSTNATPNLPKHMNDFEAMKVLKNLLTLSSISESVKLSPATINELNMNLKELQSRSDLNTGNQQSPPS